MRVRVDTEWGRLREAVFGIPSSQALRRVHGMEFVQIDVAARATNPDSHAFTALRAELDAAVRILDAHNVVVHRPKPVTNTELAFLDSLSPAFCIQVFARDPILVLDDWYIELETRNADRRRERFGIRRALDARLAESEVRAVSMPAVVGSHAPVPGDDPPPAEPDPGAFLEGGDVLLLGRDILVGLSGKGSNAAGVRWLQRLLGPTHRVHGVPLSWTFQHLDCCLMTPREGLAVVCPDAFLDGLPKVLDGWDLIEVTIPQAKALACNGLVLDAHTLVMATGHEALCDALRKRDLEVIETPCDALARQEGGLRCCHHPLVRE